MLVEAIDKIRKMAVDASTRVVEVVDKQNHQTFVFPPNGETLTIPDKEPELSFGVSHLEGVVDLCMARSGEESEIVISVDINGIHLVSGLYQEWKHDLSFELVITRAWRHMHTTPVALTQREFVAWCREKMDGTGLQDLVTVIRQVEFSNASSARGIVERGRDSLGKSVEAAVSNVDTFPGKVIAKVSKLVAGTGLDFPFDVTLNIEPLPAEQKFLVWFDLDDVINAELATRRSIVVLLKNRIEKVLGPSSAGLCTFVY